MHKWNTTEPAIRHLIYIIYEIKRFSKLKTSATKNIEHQNSTDALNGFRLPDALKKDILCALHCNSY